MPTVFHPEHSPLDRVFSAETRYIIPAYQRSYAWQALGKSDKNNQINQMWEDLWSFFRDNREDKEYFLGSMVIIEKKRREFEVVDGQQRLTSLILLFTAMRCFLERCLTLTGQQALTEELRLFAESGVEKLKRFVYNEQGLGLAPTLKVRIERSAGYDFDGVLNLAAKCKPIASVASLDAQHREVAERYFRNRDYFREQIEREFSTGGTMQVEQARLFDAFFRFLQTRVAIVTIRTEDFETAFSIFEILNNRGLPLTNKDLLRNFVINELDRVGAGGAEKWYALEEDYALTEGFMTRWVESINAAQQRYVAFNAIKDIYERKYADGPLASRIEKFIGDFERDLGHYTVIVERDRRVQDLDMRFRVEFIMNLGNAGYSTNLLLALFRAYGYDGNTPPPEMLGLVRAYQRHALHVLLEPRRRFSSTPVYQAIRFLNEGKPDLARGCFALDAGEQQQLVDRISGPLDNEAGKLLVAAYLWHTFATDEDVVQQSLQYEKATLEHIIPVAPAKGSNWERDFSPQFRAAHTNTLGNMTLLTAPINSRAKNSDFSKKKTVYARTHLGITRALAELPGIDEAYVAQRHERLVQGVRVFLGL